MRVHVSALPVVWTSRHQHTDYLCSTGQDPQWAKPRKDNTIPATESHVGEGQPANGVATAPDGQQQPVGEAVPASQ